MRVTITIDCDNEAFEIPGTELARILRTQVVPRIQDESRLFDINLFDVNGNRVGIFEVTEESSDG